MKSTITVFLLLLSFSGFSQVNILDSNIAYDSLASQTLLTVYLSPPVSNSDLTTLQVKIGSTYGGNDIVNSSYNVGTDVSISSNRLQVPLSGISAGEYVAVTVTRDDASTQRIEYKTH